MSHFSLRPVADKDRSRSPTGSTSTASSHTPPPLHEFRQLPGLAPPQPLQAPARPRRPLSPSSLRDVDLTRDANAPARKWPAPPTGHELMALFPPAPPVTVLTGPTSDYFQREERAFFAKAGKEIVRVRIEVDMPREGDAEVAAKLRSREHSGPAARQWHPNPNNPPSQSQSPPQASPTERLPASFPPQQNGGARMSRGPVTVTTQPLFPINSHPSPQPAFHPPHTPGAQHPAMMLRTPSHEQVRLPPGNPLESMPDEFREDPDEAWRHPMPHNQRRRAGKHTRRVVVKA